MADPLRVLVVEDEADLSEVLCETLRSAGLEATAATTVAAARDTLARVEVDVVLLDITLPDGSGLQVLQQVHDEGLPTEAIVLTGDAAVTTAIGAMKLGAYDYLIKPPRTEEIEALTVKAGEKARLRGENAALRARLERQQPVVGLITQDEAMNSLVETVLRAAASGLPLLVQGESGTGKELVARAIHRGSPAASQPFVAVNCAAVPENLIESELFGHEKGAFTGAIDRKPGLFEVAGPGTVFLDEVAEMGLGVQAKLLRAIESREFFRVGGTRIVRFHARVVSAVNRDLLAEVEAGRFRQDLYYRLAGVVLNVPPLRERRGDVAVLAHHFLAAAGSRKLIAPETRAALEAYPWPGNVRELRMVMERAAILSNGDTIVPADLRLAGSRPAAAPAMRTDLTLAEMERAYIKAVLDRCQGHRGKAARALGIDPKTLYNKLGPERPRS
ncbi:MAG TPA: sigma-54 dependent transcriptional regulator [Vicinamibacteria bacterium]|nr:sigma-54 dependent transcriptional regulator [Vicinamibacteria bacterium]